MGFFDRFKKENIEEAPVNGKANFKYLEKLIKKENNELILDVDIISEGNESIKYKDGIKITKNNIIINGNGHYIDANQLSRIFLIKANNVTFKNIIFLNGFSENYGGAILNDENSSIRFENCKFNNNKSKIAGAIYNFPNSKSFLDNCIFDSNSSESYGGAFVNEMSVCELQNCKFINNSSNRGGCIFNPNGILTIQKSIFENNMSNEYAAAIYNYQNAKLDVLYSDFNNNSALQGGSIVTLDSSTTIQHSNFNNNFVEGAGGSIFASQTKLKLISCTFKENDATDGGAIKVDSNSKLNVLKCIFENNKSEDDHTGGGAIYIEKSSIVFDECVFKNNSSNNGGGAIYNILSEDTSLNSCSFLFNSAVNNGGAINNIEGYINLNSCIFESNSADNYGGAINNQDSMMDIDHCEFEDNSIKLDGGSICNIGLESSSNLTIKNSNFERSKAKNGSAISNYNASTKIFSSTFENNQSERGGAIFNDKSSNLAVDSSIFSDNSAGVGGAIDNWNFLSINDCSFEGNVSVEYVAGAVCHMSGDLKIKESRFEENVANTAGSSLVIMSGSVNIMSSNFENNKSKSSVIMNLESSLLISESNFENNDSGDAGILNGGNLTLNSVTFVDENKVVIANKGDLTIDGCEFDENSKLHNIGSINVLDDNEELINNMIEKIDISKFDKDIFNNN